MNKSILVAPTFIGSAGVAGARYAPASHAVPANDPGEDTCSNGVPRWHEELGPVHLHICQFTNEKMVKINSEEW